MKIKLIDFGVPEHQRPYRPHGNDAGADVYLPYDCTLQPGEVAKIPLGFGLEIPDGYRERQLSTGQHSRSHAVKHQLHNSMDLSGKGRGK